MATERAGIVKFVLEVEKNPCLYNYTVPEYVRKDLVEKAWADVGKKVNMSGPECKEKWRKVRSVFVQNLKPPKNGSAPKRRKPYYLNEVMQFTLPFLRFPNSLAPGNLPISSNQHDDCIIDDNSNEEDNPLSFGRQKSTGSQEWPSSSPMPKSSTQSMTGPSSRPSEKKIRKADSNIDDDILQYKAKRGRKESLEILEQNPKKMFLLSLQPDVELMSDGQMRVFKRRAAQVIDQILNERPSKS